MLVVAFALLLPMPACGWLVDAVFASIDADGDGIDEKIDCNDSNPGVGAKEEHEDADGDGYGDPEVGRVADACKTASGWVFNADDCNDADPARYTDQTWYIDSDLDGWGGDVAPETCASEQLYSARSEDCDNGDSTVYPGAPTSCDEGEDERKDHDCDGLGDCPAPTGEASTSDGDAIYTGEANSQLGTALSPVGDWNGDDLPELALGAPGTTSTGDATGAVAVVLSPFNSDWTLGADEGDIILLVGEEDGDEVGAALGAGDLDGDGYADLLVGAPGAGSSVVGGWGFGPGDGGVGDGVGDGDWDIDLGPTGNAYVAVGPLLPGSYDLGELRSTALAGHLGGGRFGTALAYVGEIEGDGYGAALISAPHSDDGDATQAGAVYLVRGPLVDGGSVGGTIEAVELIGRAHHDRLGSAVLGQADILGDGSATLVVAAPTDGELGEEYGASESGAGCIYLIGATGLDDGQVDQQSQLSVCGAPGEGFGWSVGAVDLDGGGVDDLVIGAPYADTDNGADAGLAYLLDGQALSDAARASPGAQITFAPDSTLYGEAAGDMLGLAVSGFGDADMDGLGDVGVGAPGENGERGAAYVFYGGISGTVDASAADLLIRGHYEPLRAGAAMRSAGDVNALGAPDILVAGIDPTSDFGSTSPGGAFLFLTDGL